MGLKDSFAKAFMKDEKPSDGKTGQSPGLSQPSVAGHVVPGSIFSRVSEPVSVQSVAVTEIDPQFYDALLSAMNKVQAPGLDELLLTMDGLATAIPKDQVSRVALSVVAKKNITTALIQGELSKRLAALETENTNFLAAAERQYSIDVGSKESDVVSTDQQITSLQDKIKELQARKAQLQEEVSAKRQIIEKKKAGLAGAFSRLKQEMALLQNQVSV